MIYYLVSHKHHYTLHPFLTYWAKDFNQHLKIFPYESLNKFLLKNKTLKYGTYIFSDIERLSSQDRMVLSRVWVFMDQTNGFKPVNHPSCSMRRYELLRTLYDKNINNFNIYRLTEIPADLRFPVFIRNENEHSGVSPLLNNQEELTGAIKSLGKNIYEIVVIEFCDISNKEGFFHKYAAYFVNGLVLPIHIMYSQNWFVKSSPFVDEATQNDEREYLENNPHKEQIKHIFELAKIQYGRIDYSLQDGKLRIWEINTNPFLLPLKKKDQRKDLKQYFIKQFKEALIDLDNH